MCKAALAEITGCLAVLILFAPSNLWAVRIPQNVSNQVGAPSPRLDARLVAQLGHFPDVVSIAISSDGQYAVTGGFDGAVWLWEAETGRGIRVLDTTRNGPVTSAAFSPDGRLVSTAGLDGLARLWEVETGREIRRIIGRAGGFTPAGRWVVAARTREFSTDSTVLLFAEADRSREPRRLVGQVYKPTPAECWLDRPVWHGTDRRRSAGTRRIARTFDCLPILASWSQFSMILTSEAKGAGGRPIRLKPA